MTQLTLLTRNGCHLCESMKTIVAHVRRAHPLTLTEIDIGTRPDLEEQFGTQIPVLLKGNQVIARYRVSTSQLIAALGQKQEKRATNSTPVAR